jgi:glutamine amidotransferase
VPAVAIVDSGGANIASLMYAFNRLQVQPVLTSDADEIRFAERVLLPGVGAAKNAMDRLRDADLVDVIRELTQPVLGICLGMQILCDGSEEEDVECLGIIPGVARRLPAAPDCPAPNMGWCPTTVTSPHPVLHELGDQAYFYYLHSYALPVSDSTLAVANHADPFSAIVSHENFIAAQFHPERSSIAGSQLLANFLRWSL